MLNLSIKIFWHFLKNNKLLVGFLCLIQIISIFASLFVFSYFASYTNANKKYDNSTSTTWREFMIKSHYISLLYPFKSRIVKHFWKIKKKIFAKNISPHIRRKKKRVWCCMYISENNTSKFNSRNIFVESIFKGLGVMCKMVSLTNPSYLDIYARKYHKHKHKTRWIIAWCWVILKKFFQ